MLGSIFLVPSFLSVLRLPGTHPQFFSHSFPQCLPGRERIPSSLKKGLTIMKGTEALLSGGPRCCLGGQGQTLCNHPVELYTPGFQVLHLTSRHGASGGSRHCLRATWFVGTVTLPGRSSDISAERRQEMMSSSLSFYTGIAGVGELVPTECPLQTRPWPRWSSHVTSGWGSNPTGLVTTCFLHHSLLEHQATAF